MLAAVAGRLRDIVAEAGMLCRIAGDEFTCLLERSGDEATCLGEDAQDQISRFQLEVRPGQFAQVRLSFGVAEFPTDGQSIDDLLNFAALATRRSKKSLGVDEAIARARVVPSSQAETMKSMPLALVR